LLKKYSEFLCCARFIIGISVALEEEDCKNVDEEEECKKPGR
jgi:hypothetical protein